MAKTSSDWLRDAWRSRHNRNIEMDISSNDNEATRSALRAIDAHGHASLLLVESLIHGLIDESVITAEQAFNVVTIAIDATEEIASDKPARPASLQRSISLLTATRQSLTAIA